MAFNKQVIPALLFACGALIPDGAAQAAEHVVEMRNKGDDGERMTFEPSFIKIAPGDTIKFVPTDKNHNAESVEEIWPDGVPQVKGKLSSEVVFTAEKDGLYLIKCLPHYGMGMIALVQVGKPVNADKLKEYKAMGLADKRLKALMEKVEQ